MPFPFTFKLSTPTPLQNPFLDGKQDAKFLTGAAVNHDADPLNLTRKFPHSPTLSHTPTTTPEDWPRSRKRSRAGERIGASDKISNSGGGFRSRPTTGLSLAQTSGYLDTPAKYRNEVNMGIGRSRMYDRQQEQIDEDDEELIQEPPTKRRRGLAGSIVSTAVSAALIGTAVGLTVYRLWRDRGKDDMEDHHEPPPPYSPTRQQPVQQQIAPPAPLPITTQFHATSKRPQRKIIPKRRRKAPVTTAAAALAPIASTSAYRPAPEFDFSMDTAEDGEFGEGNPEDQFSSLSSKLNSLIEEGRRALNREIVVDGDDDEGPWSDEEDGKSHSRSPRKKARERSSTLTRESSHRSGLSASASAPLSISRATGEGYETWEGSPQLGEEMRRARERVLAQRGRAA